MAVNFFFFNDSATTEIYTLSLHDALPIFKALMFLTLMRPSLVLFLVLWLKLVKDFLKVRCRLALLPFLISCFKKSLTSFSHSTRNKTRRSEERFSRNAETDLVCRLLLAKK